MKFSVPFHIVSYYFLARGGRRSDIIVGALEGNSIGGVCVAIDVGAIIGRILNCLPFI